MSDAQLLAFALGGGLRGDGGPSWTLQPALARLKQLLLVGWLPSCALQLRWLDGGWHLLGCLP